MKTAVALALFPVLGLVCVAGATDSNRFAFDVPHVQTVGDDLVSMERLLVVPAGRNGFVRAVGDRFENDVGEIRFFGVNFTGAACFPSREEAEAEAARLARLGVNCVRFHYMDAVKADWDRFDALAAALKRRGIYWNFNLHVAHALGEAEGLPKKAPPNGKIVSVFHPQYRAWLKEFARKLLGRVNPHTGLRYADDPALAMVEIDNEESLVVPWLMGDPDHWLGCLETMEKPYRDELCRQWNGWRTKRGLKPQDAFPARTTCPSAERPTVLAFLSETDREYYGNLRTFLREELGVKCPVSGTQLWYATPQTLATLDYVDNHRYWRHPQWDRKPASWTLLLYTGGDALVNGLETVIALANERVGARPYTVSEYNHPYPNPFGAEAMPLLCAMGALEGWNGVFHYSYSHRPNPSVFDSIDRTDMLAHYPACATLFLRGDLPRAGRTSQRVAPERDFFDAMLGWNKSQFNFNAFRPGLAETPEGLAKSPCVSWNRSQPGKAYFTVDTPNVKLFTGFPEGRTVRFEDGLSLAIGATERNWATVSLVSRFDKAFGPGDSALIAATSGGGFTGEEIVSDSWGEGFPNPVLGVRKTGHLPYLCEGVPFELTLPKRFAQTRCRALGPDGTARDDVQRRINADGTVTFAFAPSFRTVWYSLAIP